MSDRKIMKFPHFKVELQSMVVSKVITILQQVSVIVQVGKIPSQLNGSSWCTKGKNQKVRG